jgi:imidazolonepropionase-like amidohydrolase
MLRRTALLLALAGCTPTKKPTTPETWLDPETTSPPSTRAVPRKLYPKARAAPPDVVLRHATIMTATGQTIEDGAIALSGGKITAVGKSADVPQGKGEIDVRGKFVTPGLIDTHSHIGVYAAPGSAHANQDGNEMTNIFTPQADAAAGYFAQDPQIGRAVAGGVTVAQILPGSGNLIGGTSVVVEMRLGTTVDDVAFPGAKRGIKMACGENPKRVYEEKGGPMSRMGLYPALRAKLEKAREYAGKKRDYAAQRELWLKKKEKGGKPESAPTPPAREDDLEVLAAVMRGEILVHVHCYRSGDHMEMMAIADDLGFQIRSFHHSLEAYKVRDRLAEKQIAVSTWSDWWGFKLEAWDGIPENAALVHEAGTRAIIHSDSATGIQRLNQEAAKAATAGRAAGVKLSDDDVLRWVTANPAWALGIDDVTGTLEKGKRGDVVVWSAHPLSVYARPERVYIAGHEAFRLGARPASDFEMGNAP